MSSSSTPADPAKKRDSALGEALPQKPSESHNSASTGLVTAEESLIESGHSQSEIYQFIQDRIESGHFSEVDESSDVLSSEASCQSEHISGDDEDDKGRGDELGGDRSFSGNRWARQETLALLKIRSDMDIAFRDASVKGPLWEQVSRMLAELGYNRSAKKCKVKFENVHKYYKRTKEGCTGKPYGKTYRFFDQLESLKNRPSIQSPTQPKPPTPTPTTTTVAMPFPNPPSLAQVTVTSATYTPNISQVQANIAKESDWVLGEALPQKPSELLRGSTGFTFEEIQPIESSDESYKPIKGSKKRRLKSLEVSEASCQSCIMDEDISQCFLYCTLFPLGYEFEKDTLIQLWMAEGFIEERTNERLEDTGSIVFHSFLSKGFIVPLSCDFNDGRPKYKVSDNNGSNLQQFSSNGYLLVEDVVPGFNLSDKWGDTSQLSHLSLHGKIDLITFEAIKKCEYLRTLLINPRHASCIKLVPRDLFLRLNLLRALKLSQTHISQLPSSIANVKSLRYIDVSETPIITLPESIGSLHKLQTLKLRGCTCFVALPKGMKNLTKLRHLELDIVGQLSSMPPGMGNLINLQNLSGFIVDRHDGFHICELKNLNNLRGEICISRLERVPNSEEAREAALLNKNYLNKLELRWSDLRVEVAEVEEGILECLRPHSGLKELHILFYGGSKLPSWFGHPSFADLTAITLYKFKNCQFLPSLGELPSLKFLYIAEMNTVSEVDYRFCRNREDQGHHAFPKLEILKFDVMLKLEGWMGVQNGDFPSLVKLTLVYCPKLSTLPTLSCLNSLKHLEIKYCPKLISMPNEGLPSSLEFLLIKDCPELKEQCSKGKGQDWCKIAHVPSIWVDNQEISAT